MIEREAAQRRHDDKPSAVPAGRTLLDMNVYQWTVLFAAWLGWGFDIFDSLLFNYVAPNAVPVLLDIPLGTAAARAATLQWTGHSDLVAADRLGDWRHHLRTSRRSARTHAHAAADHDDVCRRNGRVCVCAEHGRARASSASSPRSALAASGRRVRRWWPKWCRKNGASKPARFSIPLRRSGCSWPRSSPIRCRVCISPAVPRWRGATCFSSVCSRQQWRFSCGCS